jgi:hypothetical protein
MGNRLTSCLNPPPHEAEHDDDRLSLTEQERKHLHHLSNLAGSNDVVKEAVASGDIFHPMHLQRAESLRDEWEEGMALLAPVIERQHKAEAERSRLRELGHTMRQAYPALLCSPLTRAEVQARLPPFGPVVGDSCFVRIQTTEGSVDLTLWPDEECVADVLMEATRWVPRFEAILHRPDAFPELVFTTRNRVRV